MQACLDLIETEGIGAVSLRKVARTAGVSPAAPYHHFADRAALLAALSTRGFELLGEHLAAARAAASDPVSALRALLVAYLEFTSEQPAYFRLMFRPELSQPDKHPDTHIAADAAVAVLTETIADCVRDGVVAADQVDGFALLCWSVGHGLAALTLDGQVGQRAAELGTDADTLSRKVVDVFGTLVTPRPN